MVNKYKLLVVLIALLGGFFLFLVPVRAQQQMEKLEDLSRYEYKDPNVTPKYQDPSIYTYDPSEKKTKSPYFQGQPQLPDALNEGIPAPRKEWSKPQELISPQDFYKPPTDVFLPFTSLGKEKEIEIETQEGKVSAEAFAQKLMPVIESITGKRISLKLVNAEEAAAAGFLVKPVEPTKEEEEKSGEEKPGGKSKDEWKLLLQKGRVSLRPPTGTSPQDIQAIVAYLVDLLGRGGEISSVGPEGIEIKLH